MNLGGRIFGYDVYRRQPGDTAAAGPTRVQTAESGGHASAIQSDVGLANDQIRLGGKYLTGGVESGIGNGFTAIVRGSVVDGTMQAGPLKVGTSFGNMDTGVSGDSNGLEAKLFGNGAAIKNNKLELCIYGVCGSVDPSPVTRVLFANMGQASNTKPAPGKN